MRKLPVSVPEDTYERLLDLARNERRSTAAQALVLIERGLRQRGGRRADSEAASIITAATGRPE